MNGHYITHLPFEAVITLLRLQDAPFIYLRFLRWSYGEDRKEGDIVSQYFDEKSEISPSRRPPPSRSIYKNVSPLFYQNKIIWCAEYYNNYNREIIGIFDNEDEAMQAHKEKMLRLEKDHNISDELVTLSIMKSDVEIQAEKLLKKVVLQERAVGVKMIFALLPIPKEEDKKVLNFDEKLEKVKLLKDDDDEKMEIDNGTEESKNEILNLNSDIDNVRLNDAKEKKMIDNENEIKKLKNEEGFEETKNSINENEKEIIVLKGSFIKKVDCIDNANLQNEEEEKEEEKLKCKMEIDKEEKEEEGDGEKEEQKEGEKEEEDDGEIDDNSIDSQDSDSLLASSEEEEDEVINCSFLYDIYPPALISIYYVPSFSLYNAAKCK